MKKKLFSLLGLMVTMVAIVTSVYVNNNTNKNNEIFNANVEALADDENVSERDCHTAIQGIPATYVVYCETCSIIPGAPIDPNIISRCKVK